MPSPRTPPPSTKSLATVINANYDTPAIAKQGSSAAVVYGDLDAKRNGAIYDSGPSVPSVELDLFFQYLLPPLPARIKQNFDKIVTLLTDGSEELAPAYQEQRWVAFSVNPSHSESRETEVFEALVDIAVAVEKAASLYSTEFVCTFSNNPNSVPESTWRNCMTRPDGHFLLRTPTLPPTSDTSAKPSWLDIAATGEYKKKKALHSINDVSLVSIEPRQCILIF